MKANKALKRLANVEDLLSDVMERYSESAPNIQEQLQIAKAAVGRAKDAVKVQASSEERSTRKNDGPRKAAAKVSPTRAKKKHGTTKRDYEE